MCLSTHPSPGLRICRCRSPTICTRVSLSCAALDQQPLAALVVARIGSRLEGRRLLGAQRNRQLQAQFRGYQFHVHQVGPCRQLQLALLSSFLCVCSSDSDINDFCAQLLTPALGLLFAESCSGSSSSSFGRGRAGVSDQRYVDVSFVAGLKSRCCPSCSGLTKLWTQQSSGLMSPSKSLCWQSLQLSLAR